MADTIGRVEFIVGFDGRRLPAEARKIGNELGAAGQKAGAEFGLEADEAAAKEFGPRLTKAGDRAAANLAEKGTLVGDRFGANLEKSVQSHFRKLERETSDALASEEGFQRLVKNAGGAQNAIDKLTSNVQKLSELFVSMGEDSRSPFFDPGQLEESIAQIEAFGGAALDTEKRNKALADSIRGVRIDADKLRLSLDPDVFSDVARELGGVRAAAARYQENLESLRGTNVLTTEQFNRLATQVDRFTNRSLRNADKEVQDYGRSVNGLSDDLNEFSAAQRRAGESLSAGIDRRATARLGQFLAFERQYTGLVRAREAAVAREATKRAAWAEREYQQLRSSADAVRDFTDAQAKANVRVQAAYETRVSLRDLQSDEWERKFASALERTQRAAQNEADTLGRVGEALQEYTRQQTAATHALQTRLDASTASNNVELDSWDRRFAALGRASDAARENERVTQLLDQRLARLDERMGDRKAFARYVDATGSSDRATRRLSGAIDAIEGLGRLSARSISGLRRNLQNLSESFQAAGDDAGGFGEKLSGLWSGASHDVKQALIIIGLVLSLGSAISTLTSGAVAALTALISSLAIGLVGLAAAAGAALVGIVWMATHAVSAIGMMKDAFPPAQAGMDALAKASEADSAAFARAWGPALADFTQKLAQLWRDDRMGEAAGEALGRITEAFTAVLNSPSYLAFQTAMETTIPNSLANLGGAAASVTEGLLQIFAQVGPFLEELTGKIATWAADWNKSIQEAAADGSLQNFFDLAFESIDKLMGFIGAVGDTLGTIFLAGAPAGNEILTILTDLFTKWNDFLTSAEGNTALQTWFDNGVAIFGALMDLLQDLGDRFSQLVTPDTVTDMVNALQNLGDGLGWIFDIMQVLGGLDVFGNLIAAFQSITALLDPLTEPLTTIATVIGDVLLAALQAIIPLFTSLGEALAPVLQPIADAVEQLGPPLITLIESLGALLEPLIALLLPIGELLGTIIQVVIDAVMPIILVLIGIITDVADAITPLIEQLLPTLSDLFEIVGGVIKFLSPIVEFLANLLGGILKIAFQVVIEIIKVAVGIISVIAAAFDSVLRPAIDFITDALDEFGNFVDDVWKNIQDAFETAINAIVDFFTPLKDVIDGAIGWFNSLFGAADDAKGAADSASRSGGGGGAARGRLVFGPRRILVGEAGPEAIVPLARPLSQVDPAVRGLSAVAQGSSAATGAISTGPARVVTVEAGAIQITSTDPWRAATETVNRITERAVA